METNYFTKMFYLKKFFLQKMNKKKTSKKAKRQERIENSLKKSYG